MTGRVTTRYAMSICDSSNRMTLDYSISRPVSRISDQWYQITDIIVLPERTGY